MTTETRRTQGGLGRGLASLIPTTGETPAREIEIARIRANPWQPRGEFDDDQLQALAASIALHGVLQPVLLTEVDDGYPAHRR